MPKRIHLTPRGKAPFLFPRILSLLLCLTLILPANPALALRPAAVRQSSGLEELEHALEPVPGTPGTGSGLEEWKGPRRNFLKKAGTWLAAGILGFKLGGSLKGGEAGPALRRAAPSAPAIPQQTALTAEKKAEVIFAGLNRLQGEAGNRDAPDRLLKVFVKNYGKTQWRALSNEQKRSYALEAAKVPWTEELLWQRIAQSPKAGGLNGRQIQEFLKALNAGMYDGRITALHGRKVFVPWRLVMGILFKETTDFNAKAILENDGHGLMQVNRTTLRDMWRVAYRRGLVSYASPKEQVKTINQERKRQGKKETTEPELLRELLLDATFNVKIGILYVREMLIRAVESAEPESFALMSYNRGEAWTLAALKAARAAGVQPLSFEQVKPYYRFAGIGKDGKRKMKPNEFAIGADYVATITATAEILQHATLPSAGLEEPVEYKVAQRIKGLKTPGYITALPDGELIVGEKKAVAVAARIGTGRYEVQGRSGDVRYPLALIPAEPGRVLVQDMEGLRWVEVQRAEVSVEAQGQNVTLPIHTLQARPHFRHVLASVLLRQPSGNIIFDADHVEDPDFAGQLKRLGMTKEERLAESAESFSDMMTGKTTLDLVLYSPGIGIELKRLSGFSSVDPGIQTGGGKIVVSDKNSAAPAVKILRGGEEPSSVDMERLENEFAEAQKRIGAELVVIDPVQMRELERWKGFGKIKALVDLGGPLVGVVEAGAFSVLDLENRRMIKVLVQRTAAKPPANYFEGNVFKAVQLTDGRIAVSEPEANRLVILNPSKMEGNGLVPDQEIELNQPRDIALLPEGRIAVVRKSDVVILKPKHPVSSGLEEPEELLRRLIEKIKEVADFSPHLKGSIELLTANGTPGFRMGKPGDELAVTFEIVEKPFPAVSVKVHRELDESQQGYFSEAVESGLVNGILWALGNWSPAPRPPGLRDRLNQYPKVYHSVPGVVTIDQFLERYGNRLEAAQKQGFLTLKGQGTKEVTLCIVPGGHYAELANPRLPGSERKVVQSKLSDMEKLGVVEPRPFVLYADSTLGAIAKRMSKEHPLPGVHIEIDDYDIRDRVENPEGFIQPGLIAIDPMLEELHWKNPPQPLRVIRPEQMQRLAPYHWVALRFNPELTVEKALALQVITFTDSDPKGNEMLIYAFFERFV
ncbi:MAG: hypothetical protein HYS41_05580 [Candidatus Omnitrophica bacterium]|nr:hypothetical protein [Candidatus Omnitrophota bacterium]